MDSPSPPTFFHRPPPQGLPHSLALGGPRAFVCDRLWHRRSPQVRENPCRSFVAHSEALIWILFIYCRLGCSMSLVSSPTAASSRSPASALKTGRKRNLPPLRTRQTRVSHWRTPRLQNTTRRATASRRLVVVNCYQEPFSMDTHSFLLLFLSVYLCSTHAP